MTACVDLLDYLREEVADGYDVMLTHADAAALLAMIDANNSTLTKTTSEERAHVRVRLDSPADGERPDSGDPRA